MSFYRTIIKRDGLNPLTGRKQYKCVNSVEDTFSLPPLQLPKVCVMFGMMYLTTTKRYQPNSFISPRKAMGI